MVKDIISMLDMKEDLDKILINAAKLKTKETKKGARKPLGSKNIVLLFEKQSLRTKASFAVAIQQLGGNAIYMGPDEVQIGERESPADVGKVLSSYFDCIIYRAVSHEVMIELSEAAYVPVINALDDQEHPCQVVADLMTILEKKKSLRGLKLAYIGDGNNVCNSLLLGGAITGMNVAAASPSLHQPKKEIISEAQSIAAENDCKIEIFTNPFKAVEEADIIYTDVWISMGEESNREEKEKVFIPYKITEKMMAKANEDAIFMHCLPAHRGLEVEPEVIDGEKSVVFEQVENRLHAQKAILLAAL